MRELSLAARVYLICLFVAAPLAVAGCLALPHPFTADVPLLLVLMVGGVLAQAFEVVAPNNKGYVVTLSVLAVAALLLGPVAGALVATVPFVVEQLRLHRRRTAKPWYIATFNVASHVLAVVAANRCLLVWDGHALDGHWAGVAVALLVVGMLLVVNHLTLTLVLKLARGISVKDSGLWNVEGLLTDSCLLGLGVVLAALWTHGPPLLLFAVAPFVLLQRAMQVPALTAASQTDGKTGLMNATHWTSLAEAELAASAGRRATTVLVADLDLLRDINNTHGHLVGDMVLSGIAAALRRSVRDGDLPARFGGEEFVVLLPGADALEGARVAERIRAALEVQRFSLDDGGEVRATVSVGVATSPVSDNSLKDLMHRADLAVYQAKARGRNRVAVHGLSSLDRAA